jgi:hypothetical protein
MKVKYDIGSNVIEGDWKFYQSYGLIEYAPIHLKDAPLEKSNVLSSHPKLADRLRGKLNDWLLRKSKKLS